MAFVSRITSSSPTPPSKLFPNPPGDALGFRLADLGRRHWPAFAQRRVCRFGRRPQLHRQMPQQLLLFASRQRLHGFFDFSQHAHGGENTRSSSLLKPRVRSPRSGDIPVAVPTRCGAGHLSGHTAGPTHAHTGDLALRALDNGDRNFAAPCSPQRPSSLFSPRAQTPAGARTGSAQLQLRATVRGKCRRTEGVTLRRSGASQTSAFPTLELGNEVNGRTK